MTSESAVAARTKDEVADAIRALSPAERIRLRKIAGFYAAYHPIEAEDLLQEAFARALDRRNWPSNIGIVPFLAEVMRSVASGESEKATTRIRLVALPKAGECEDPPDPVALAVDDKLNAEEAMVEAERLLKVKLRILAVFDDDPIAHDIVEGIMAEYTGEELWQLSGLNETAYSSKRRLIRRRLEKAFPKGFKP